MRRAVIIGNSGGGKSTLARRLGAAWQCPPVEIDGVMWQPGWQLKPVEVYNAEHARLISGESWIIDGLGRLDSIPARLACATDIVLVDMPLWVHFWLAAERQIQWAAGSIEYPPAGLAAMPSTEALFRTIWEVDQTWMPEIRRLVALEEQRGKRVFRLGSVVDLDGFDRLSLTQPTPGDLRSSPRPA
jgi:adenylate kinase family enzyme